MEAMKIYRTKTRQPSCDGWPDVEKMGLIAYDPIRHYYVEFVGRAGGTFSDGWWQK